MITLCYMAKVTGVTTPKGLLFPDMLEGPPFSGFAYVWF